jgi:hypothetical protein
MSDPTLAMTFGDYILRVAEYLGVADYSAGTAAVPTDTHDLELCKRLVNDGWRDFYNSNARWNWVNRLFSITFDPDAANETVNVGGDNWRYYMPDGFYGDLQGPLTYAGNTGRMSLGFMPEQEIRDRYAQGDVSGYPVGYDIRPIAEDYARRWELIVWPKPSAALTVVGKCRLYPNRMIELTDKPCCGFIFDAAIEAASKAQAEMQRQDGGTEKQGLWATELAKAVMLDLRSAPRRLGNFGGGRRALCRPYTGVDTYTDIDGDVTTL